MWIFRFDTVRNMQSNNEINVGVQHTGCWTGIRDQGFKLISLVINLNPAVLFSKQMIEVV